jgi:predicted metal-dependent hydrolase
MDDPLCRAIHLFNASDWYAAHDAFEELWHQSQGQDRDFLHGLIQISVAEHHLSNGNRRGALLLMAEGLNHLQKSDPYSVGYDLNPLISDVRERLLQLQGGHTPEDLPLSQLMPFSDDND